jgi:heme/copper-type cytochrome/quinol oxidase subunit 2
MTMQSLRQRSNRLLISATACAVGGILLMMSLPMAGQSRVIEVLADKNSRFRVVGQDRPEITVKAGEPLLLRIEARKGKSWNRNGAIHGFTLLRAKDRAKVPGWDLELQPGVQEFNLIAPSSPGKYEVLCTVICSGDHEGMRMKFLVVP